MAEHPRDASRLPKGWQGLCNGGFLAAVALARVVVSQVVDGLVTGSRIADLAAQVTRHQVELALVRRELELIDARLRRVPTRRRSHFEPAERLEILALRSARGWTVAETARRFLVTPETIAAWFRRRDEEAAAPLVGKHTPANRFPDHVRAVVTALRSLFPFLGTRKIAQVLARTGLQLAETTVRRMVRREPPSPKGTPPSPLGRRAHRARRKAGVRTA